MPDPTPLDPESQRLALFVEGNQSLEKMGAVSFGTPMGNRARGLFAHGHLLG